MIETIRIKMTFTWIHLFDSGSVSVHCMSTPQSETLSLWAHLDILLIYTYNTFVIIVYVPDPLPFGGAEGLELSIK